MRGERRIFFLLFILAAILRLHGIAYGLPYSFGGWVDEEVVVKSAIGYAYSAAHLEIPRLILVYPEFFGIILGGVYGIVFIAGKVLGIFASADDFAYLYLTAPGYIHLIGRLVSAAAGVATVLVTYRIGRVMAGRRAGIAAGIFLAVSYTHIERSHLALPDTTATLLSAISLLLLIRTIETGSFALYIGAGLLMGLSASAKYTTALCLLPFLVVASRRDPWARLLGLYSRWLWAAAAATILGFLLGSPDWVIQFQRTFSIFLSEGRTVVQGGYAIVGTSPYIWIARELAGKEALLGILFIHGFFYILIRSVARREEKDLVILSFILPSIIVMGRWRNEVLYYLLFILPPLAAVSGAFLTRAFRRLPGPSLLIALLIAVPTLSRDLERNEVWAGTDTRVEAKEWIEETIPPGTRILYPTWPEYHPPLLDPEDLLSMHGYEREISSALASRLNEYIASRRAYDLIEMRLETDTPGDIPGVMREEIDPGHKFYRYLLFHRWMSPDEILSSGADYLVLSSLAYDRFFLPPPPEGNINRIVYERDRAFYEPILAGEYPFLEEAAVFAPPDDLPEELRIYRPTIRIYAVFHPGEGGG